MPDAPDENDEGATTRYRPELPASGETVGFLLEVIEGPEAGQSITVDGGTPSRVYLGTSVACGLRLSDRSVSRRHAAVEVLNGALRLTDLGSTNGTWANGIALLEANLSGGEVIRLGATAIRVDAIRSAAPVALTHTTSFGRLLGASAEMRRIYPLCERVAASDLSVLIEGETGTGKEVLAEAIHEASPRRARPFVVFDCTTVAPALMESALFGHERGAFTGAVQEHRGVFEQAQGGTLLIDEIGDLELSLQPKLLRAIERGEVRRAGGTRWIQCQARVIAATRRDLEQEIVEGRFRDDLFYRLAIARIELAPLRKRTGDIALLMRHFWTQLGGAGEPSPEDLRRFERYSWPGNVRELYNAVSARLALGDLARIEALRSGSEGGQGEAPPGDTNVIDETLALDLPLTRARQRVVEEFERRYLERVLAQNGGVVVKAAAASGIARRYFQILRARQGGPRDS